MATYDEISIHVPREGHDSPLFGHSSRYAGISIHVPREGHDAFLRFTAHSHSISIHVPREGHDVVALSGRC